MASSREGAASNAPESVDAEDGVGNSVEQTTKTSNLLQEVKKYSETSGETSEKQPELDKSSMKSTNKAVTLNVTSHRQPSSLTASLEHILFPKHGLFDDIEDIDEGLDNATLNVMVVHSAPLVNLKSILKPPSSMSLCRDSVSEVPSPALVDEEVHLPTVDTEPCGDSYDLHERKVKWKPEVDVIYYAGDSVVGREIEDLCEELEQHTRKAAYVRGYTRIPSIR